MAVIAGGAAAGLWFVPFAAGLAAGLVNRIGGWRARAIVPAVAGMAVAGWGIPLWWPALHGEPAGGTARVIAALAARPASATAGVLVTLLVAAVQALAGLGLGRALTRPARPAIADAEAMSAEALDAENADADGGSGRQPGPAGPTMGE